jgi:hypothetical protein
MICLTLSAGSLPLIAQENSKTPLSIEDEREVLRQLIQLESERMTRRLLEEQLQKEHALEERERSAAARELEAQKALTTAAEQGRGLERDRAETYKGLYQEVKKKPGGLGCRVKQILTLGLGRCG